ncbi:HNH endonuclease signature motif containing protein [Blautia sp.]
MSCLDPRSVDCLSIMISSNLSKICWMHPFCEQCYDRGILVETQEIHHKLPLSEGGTHDRSNLIALCKSCHSQIHAKRGDRWHDR